MFCFFKSTALLSRYALAGYERYFKHHEHIFYLETENNQFNVSAIDIMWREGDIQDHRY